ncbi:uncharacterized protein MYCFIDRAFT_205522 [Pseudocercospora fijiensis CIRAD86]|uniref:Uncharacterized protein n=1 Tax=Pseudocercospora fijiensis (strain CIRAD86) TaxID=383855 RepID=M3AIF0_PSEFD|nr:uncharacterized protein MYCFIDRAFT_205522 [Pseudocercospora fijiensis CIRAD86]EME76983.1 hypothetical protein MYCFIDRAFT_205522 [Pseudocercospora fijiensis CIRAD86]
MFYKDGVAECCEFGGEASPATQISLFYNLYFSYDHARTQTLWSRHQTLLHTSVPVRGGSLERTADFKPDFRCLEVDLSTCSPVYLCCPPTTSAASQSQDFPASRSSLLACKLRFVCRRSQDPRSNMGRSLKQEPGFFGET